MWSGRTGKTKIDLWVKVRADRIPRPTGTTARIQAPANFVAIRREPIFDNPAVSFRSTARRHS
jgi:hypothetical protein